jgi:hypothetical protein
MTGQPPYTPFENDKVEWLPPDSETAAPALAPRAEEELAQRRPTLVLFLAGRDGSSCCAANYERFVFRDRRVLELAQQFVTVRTDRSSLQPDELKRWGLTPERPAIVVSDGDGIVRARFDACTNSKDVADALEVVLKASAQKVRVGEQLAAAFAELDELLAKRAWRAAGTALRKLIRTTRNGPVAGVPRAERMLAALGRTGDELFAAALAQPAPEERYRQLMELRHEFWDFDVVERIRLEITGLVEGEATRGPVREYQARCLLEEGEAKLAKGERGVGRALLLKVGREFPGTQAAARAQELLAQR